MPKKSEKYKFVKFYKEVAFNNLLVLELFGKNDDKHRQKEEEILEDLTLVMAAAENTRCGCDFLHNSVPKSRNFVVDILPNLDENRFRQIARVGWNHFQVILDLIQDDEVFHGPRSCKQFPVQIQLLVVLYRLGSSGEGATIAKIANLFGIGDGGTIQNITNRVFNAILKHTKKFLDWPNSSERQKVVSDTIHELPYCVGYVDGTEIKLAEKPSEDSEAYFSRKHIYSLKVQAVCDNKLLIRHLVLGYPGSVHDARIYNNCDLSIKSQEFLTGSEWLAGDSAYKLTGTLITPFRSNSTESTLQQRNYFNQTFSRYRIRIEHCFGLLKERFNSLKELKIQIKGDTSIKLACRWIVVCSILHNIIMMQKGENFYEISDNRIETTENEEPENEHQNSSTNEGAAKRLALLEMLQ